MKRADTPSGYYSEDDIRDHSKWPNAGPRDSNSEHEDAIAHAIRSQRFVGCGCKLLRVLVRKGKMVKFDENKDRVTRMLLMCDMCENRLAGPEDRIWNGVDFIGNFERHHILYKYITGCRPRYKRKLN